MHIICFQSVKRIASELQNVVLVKAVPDPKFNHVDMYIGNNAPYILYPDIIEIFNNILKNKSSLDTSKKTESTTVSKTKQVQYLYSKKKIFDEEEEEIFALTERLTKLYTKQNPSLNMREEWFSFTKTETDDSYGIED